MVSTIFIDSSGGSSSECVIDDEQVISDSRRHAVPKVESVTKVASFKTFINADAESDQRRKSVAAVVGMTLTDDNLVCCQTTT